MIRDINYRKYLKTKQITVISGIRRSGKSTLLRQFAQKLNNYYFLNLDDERLADFELTDFANLILIFKKLYPAKVIFIDEIQNIDKWELFIRRIHDEGYKIFLSGSNAKLLSSELATRLTGRYFKIELYPFSFKEYLNLKKIDYYQKTTLNIAKILKNFDKFLSKGGSPAFLKYEEEEFIKRIYGDILNQDLLIRFRIKEIKNFKQLANYLMTNFTNELSYNNLKKVLGFKSVTTVKDYIEFMQESYLVFELYKYNYSLKKQYTSDKKFM